jgi:hypothetical protein
MGRLIVVAVLATSLLVSGCATQRRLLPADEDPDALAAAIARRGRGEAPPGPEGPAGTPIVGNCLEIAGWIGMICLCVPLAVLYCMANSSQPWSLR